MVSSCIKPFLTGPATFSQPKRSIRCPSLGRNFARAMAGAHSETREDARSLAAKLPGIALSLLAAATLSLSPVAGPALAQQSVATEGLATETKPAGNAGANALVEGSDLTNESVESILDKLRNKVLPESKAMVAKASDDGSTYTASIAKEIEIVEQEVESQIQEIDAGGKVSESTLKSFLSGVEQQLNALKASGGFD